MNQMTPPPKIEIIPSSAPFSEAQRSWLNGVFAGLLSTELNLHGAFWHTMAGFNLNRAGFIIVGMFAVTWIIALSVWHFGHIEQRWDTAADHARAASANTPETVEELIGDELWSRAE